MDYQTKPLSDEDIRKLAKRLRRYFNVPAGARVDVRACLKKGKIWTVRGEQRLDYFVRPDSDMGDDDAVTSYSKGVVTIAAKESVDWDAEVGVGRARMTLVHELGHAVMHDSAPKARKTGATGKTTPNWMKPFESAEHQAKVFAPAFLIDTEAADKLPNANAISIQFGVSRESARICFENFEIERNRAKAAERVARMAAAFGTPVPDPGPPKYMAERCTSCGQQTLYPSGSKFNCATCSGAVDRFQDGDSLDP